jgi:ribosomal protein S18 acetylase RimI-like enzyme
VGADTPIEIITGAEAADPEAIQREFVALAARLNPLPEHHIAFFGLTQADIEAVLGDTAPASGTGILLARAGPTLVGGLALDYDAALGRAWLLGPFVDHAGWADIAGRLYAAALPLIPAAAIQHELFCDVRHLRCREFAVQLGFALHGETGIETFARARLSLLPPADPAVAPARPEQRDALDVLHRELFPHTYASAQQLFERDADQSRVFVLHERGRLLGYVACKVTLETGEGYIDYVGTGESARRRGVARRIVIAALHWMFAFPEVQSVSLTVNADNVAAEALYRSLGFERERVTRVYRRTLERAAQGQAQ